MAAISAMFEQTISRVALTLTPVSVRWNALEPGPRRLVVIGAALLTIGFLAAFVWLPAVRTRDALAVRLPQLEIRLAVMRNQAREVKALANASLAPVATPVATRTAADVAALQSIFGAGAQIAAAEGGFRIVIPAIAYATWWDKTGDALSRHPLVLRSASLTRVDGSGASGVAVDMRLGAEARTPGSSSTAAVPGK